MKGKLLFSIIVLFVAVTSLATGVFAQPSAGGAAPSSLMRLPVSGSEFGLAQVARQVITGTVAYARTVVISPGASAAESGKALLDAMDSISDASAAYPCLLRVQPGIYDLGIKSLRLKPYVDVEGAGEDATTISAGGMGVSRGGTVIGADNAELRSLSVSNSGGQLQYATAIYNEGTAPKITHVTAMALGAIENYAVANFDGSAPVMTDVTATAIGQHSVAEAADAGSVSIGVYNYGSSPIMTNVTATVTGTSNNMGVFNLFSSSPTMVNVTASASGSQIRNTAVYNFTECSPTIKNSTLTATGPGINVGLRNDLGSPVVYTSTISASGGTTSLGIENISVGVLKLSNCQISGSTSSIRNEATFSTHGFTSKLEGGPIDGTGKINCAATIDPNASFVLGAVCIPVAK